MISIEPDAAIFPNPNLSELVPGMKLIDNFISEEEETNLMMELDKLNPDGSNNWTEIMSRRVQVD